MLGHPWTDLLQRVSQKCSRSALRGLAGPMRSDPFDLCRVFETACTMVTAVTDGGPMHIAPMIVCATFFMLREIEASGIQVADVTFGHLSVTLSLPVSKVDWKAKGAKRTWQCICGSYDICPFHVMHEHMKNLTTNDELSPVFPANDGGFCTKTGVIETIRHVAQLSGQQVQDASGAWLLSGHTFRITGARALARMGLDAITIQLLGRWGSDAVLSYLAEAPLANLGDKLKGTLSDNRLAQHSSSSSSCHLASERGIQWVGADEMMREHRNLKDQLESLARVFADLNRRTTDLTEEVDGIALLTSERNDQSGVVHRALISLSTSPSSWVTMCGWKFAGKDHAITYRFEEEAKGSRCCKKCPKCHKHLSSSASSSDSSSSDD